MASTEENPKISTFSRILAWVFVVCGAFIVVDVTVRVFVRKQWIWSFGETMALAVGVFVVCPLFLFVALKGRSPRWLTSIETMYDREAEARGIRLTTNSPPRTLVSVVASAVFGLILILFGNWLGIFSGETGWFAITVFAIVWLIVATVLWRNRKSGRAGHIKKETDLRR